MCTGWKSSILRFWKPHILIFEHIVFIFLFALYGDFPGGSAINSLPARQETWAQSLGHEFPLEKEMATHSSNSCMDTPTDRGVSQATVRGVAKSQAQLSDERTTIQYTYTAFSLSVHLLMDT